MVGVSVLIECALMCASYLSRVSPGQDVAQQRYEVGKSMSRGIERANSRYPQELLDQIKEARREKIRNKTRERERERRGDYSRSTIERMRKRPPAHILEKMSAKDRRADAIVRTPSEVGYVGMMKSRLGVKMRNPNLWRKLENGTGGNSEVRPKSLEIENEYDARGEGEGDGQ